MKYSILSILLFFIFNSTAQIDYAVSFGDSSDDKGTAVAADASGNTYAAGYFSGIIDADPGPGVVNLVSSPYAMQEMYLIKFDASGNFVWARQSSNDSTSNSSVLPNSVFVDASGIIYIAGSYIGKVDFDPGAAVSD